MGIVVNTTPEEFPALIKKRLKTAPQAVRRGMKSAALRGITLLVRRTPKDRGQAKASWKLRGALKKGYVIVNDAPHIAVLEFGRRPGPVSREGKLALAGWFMRKLGLDAKEAWRAAQAYAQYLKTHAQPPLYFVRDSMEELQRMNSEEINRELNKHSSSKRPK